MTLATARPCRRPPQMIADVGLIGGGQVLRPVEVSVALKGYIICIPGLRCRSSAHEIGHHSHPRRPLVIGSSGSGGMITGRSYQKPLDR